MNLHLLNESLRRKVQAGWQRNNIEKLKVWELRDKFTLTQTVTVSEENCKDQWNKNDP